MIIVVQRAAIFAFLQEAVLLVCVLTIWCWIMIWLLALQVKVAQFNF